MISAACCLSLIISLLVAPISSYRAPRIHLKNGNNAISIARYSRRTTRCKLVENSFISLAAGALAGSIGVGVAYPLDALKTKAQTYASSKGSNAGKWFTRGDIDHLIVVDGYSSRWIDY